MSAFKHQSAHHLIDLEHRMEGDVLLCGNDDAAKTLVAGLVTRIKDLRPVDVGDLRNARVFEAMTALLLNVNRKHKTRVGEDPRRLEEASSSPASISGAARCGG